ncbi:Uncharacterised protein [Neisseria gonorrhoeae]|uniref:Uncharacterized protein n=1 Tax=Neisseria gonorrhoeae TaxID=485 RepID=A0A378W2P4_NEIGO|nr:Uncharacterised protein [Neisseria gonorrhoeae]
MFQQVGQTFCQGFEVFFTKVGAFHAAVVFQGADSRHDDCRIRFQTGKAAFDVAEFFRTQVRAEACFGYGVIGKVFARRVAVTELQPWAMLANGPPCTKAGVPSMVCTKLGLIASFSNAAIAPCAFKSLA